MKLINLIKNNLLFFIILIGFFVRSFYFYYNDDAQVYVLWLKHFVNTGELLTIDHPPLFFLVSAMVVKIILALLSFGNMVYWLVGFISIIAVWKIKRLNLPSKLIISLSLIYLWFVGYYLEIYEIAATISFLFGMLAIYIVYKLGEILFNKNVGILASLLLSLSWWHIIYSKIPLIDGFATTLIIWSLYEYTKLLNKSKIKKKDIILPSLSLSLAFYSKYYVLFVLPSVFLLLFLELRKRQVNKFLYFLPILISVIIFIPWVLYTNFYLKEHYALSHYFFVEFPSKLAFINFFVKVLAPPVFTLFVFTFFIALWYKKNLKEQTFLLSLILIPLMIYLKYTYVDGASHALINLSNYMLYTLPFACLFVSSGLDFIERKFHIKVLDLLCILLIITLIFQPFNDVTLEYDKNYKTFRGNLDSINQEETKKIPIKLPTLHYAYNFVGYTLFQSKFNPKLLIHYRWSSIDKLDIYSLSEKNVTFKLFVRGFYNDSLIINYKNTTYSFVITREGNEIEFTLQLAVGKNSVYFSSGRCAYIYKNKCVNFVIEDRGYRFE
jgi:4-amino-4-deoxy-L-arabinose transferase-like glycosyltransferase